MRELRRNYELKTLEREDLASDPLAQFQLWWDEAIEAEHPDWLELNAVSLATYDPQSRRVDARMVLLKHVDERGLMFFTNYESAKGHQVAEHPAASMVMYWPHLERQVRVQGQIVKTDRQTSERYFHERPRSSQLGAAASQQSARIASRRLLEEEVARLDALYAGVEVPCPEHWGGYILQPTRMEFWQGRRDRLHDRFQYTKEDQGGWAVARLAP